MFNLTHSVTSYESIEFYFNENTNFIFDDNMQHIFVVMNSLNEKLYPAQTRPTIFSFIYKLSFFTYYSTLKT